MVIIYFYTVEYITVAGICENIFWFYSADKLTFVFMFYTIFFKVLSKVDLDKYQDHFENQ